jgi:uncharacterized protein with PQ loop repeat
MTMTLHDLAILSGYAGAAFGVSMVIPQISRTFRNRTLGGVSAVSWSLSAIGCLCWLLYGVRRPELPQIPGNVLIVIGASVIVLAVPSHVPTARRAVYLGATGLGISVLAFSVPPTVLGYLAFAIGLVSAWPQTLESIARARRGEPSAVSIGAWLLRGTAQVCWLGYALVMHDLTVTIAAAVTLTSAAILVAAEQRRQATFAARTLEPALASA